MYLREYYDTLTTLLLRQWRDDNSIHPMTLPITIGTTTAAMATMDYIAIVGAIVVTPRCMALITLRAITRIAPTSGLIADFGVAS